MEVVNISPFNKPVFHIPALPYGFIDVGVCSKAQWDRLKAASTAGDTAVLSAVLSHMGVNLPDSTPSMLTEGFAEAYIKAVEAYCERYTDIFGIPEKPDFENDEGEALKLPVMTFGERLVYEHSGLDFFQISCLDILDYRMLLADAVKVKCLRREDGKGKEYLNECYDFMHRISNMFE